MCEQDEGSWQHKRQAIVGSDLVDSTLVDSTSRQ